MKTIRAFKLSERVNTGDVVIKDVFGAGYSSNSRHELNIKLIKEETP